MKKTYQEMLKENLSEFDTTKTVDVKGPMLDPILGYEGDGELPTYKDAASVLERYYFGEKRSEHEISEMDYENDKGESKGEEMKHTEGPEGEEQAGTSNAGDAKGGAREKEKDIAKEAKESDEGEVVSEKEMNTGDLKSKNMKDSDGPEGEEQAGTGDTYKEFKKRVVEAVTSIAETIDDDAENLDESDDNEEEEEEKDEEKDEDKDEEKEEVSEVASAVPGGPSPKKKGEDWEDDEEGYSSKNESEELEAEEDITEALENEIIEKLIAEMEEETIEEQEEVLDEQEEDDAPPEKEEADEEGEEGEEKEGLDVDKKMEEMVNRLTQGHTEGPEGEEQAGTGGDEKVIPPRKDRSNEGTKEKGTKPMDKGELADTK